MYVFSWLLKYFIFKFFRNLILTQDLPNGRYRWTSARRLEVLKTSVKWIYIFPSVLHTSIYHLCFFFRCVFSSTLGLSRPQKYTPIRKVAVQYYKKLIFVCFSIPPPVKENSRIINCHPTKHLFSHFEWTQSMMNIMIKIKKTQ